MQSKAIHIRSVRGKPFPYFRSCDSVSVTLHLVIMIILDWTVLDIRLLRSWLFFFFCLSDPILLSMGQSCH